MLCLMLALSILFLTSAEQNPDSGYCDIDANTCGASNDLRSKKLLFYDVNPPEGFNLRRDVYMRFAIMLAEARKHGKKVNWTLVLPPWYRLYHWKSNRQQDKPLPWSLFFDVESLKSHAPVAELHEIFSKTSTKTLQIDTLYVLQNYADAFEDGTFVEKWEMDEDDCGYDGRFWGYGNVTARETICVRYQGKISMLLELMSLHRSDKSVMFAHGEIPLHDAYGTKPYWDCRKSMKFNEELVNIAKDFIRKNLDCNIKNCSTYISIHWRRQDFARGRKNDVPSVSGTAKQIDKLVNKKSLNIHKIFIASDASITEIKELENQLNSLGYEVYNYSPSVLELDTYKDGGVAIVDQIICSHAAFFIGTHESTFSFRIQEEREILGFESSTTFNRFCPDSGRCERPSKWTLVD